MPARTPHPELHRNLVLIGGRGCGKSSIAKRIVRTNRNFMLFSTDALMRYECSGAGIPEIVAERGWPGFRELELQVVERVSSFSGGALIDCGGGVVVDLDDSGEEVYSERKVDALRRNGLVVYLSRDFEYLQERVSGDRQRPSLSESRGFREIMERRDPWYRRAADLVLDCRDISKTSITDRIVRWYYGELGI
jgi:shikimate kinase